MMKKIFAGLIWMMMIAAGSGCGESFLDLDDTGSISENNFPTSLEHIDLMLVSVYGVQHETRFPGLLVAWLFHLLPRSYDRYAMAQ